MSQELEDYRRTSYESWQQNASGWGRLREAMEASSALVREWLLRELAPQPGQTLLEIAAGVGETGFAAAAMVGDAGRLISTDFSPAMVEEGRRRGRALGIENVEHRVMDAERMDLDDDSVDGVLCRYGYMLMADPAAALAETRRVLRPGGKVALAVWGPLERNPTFSVIGGSLVRRGHVPPPEPGMPGQFSMAGEERIRGLLAGAGFTDVRVEEVAVRFRFGDLAAYLALITGASSSVGSVVGELSDDERAAVAGDVEAGFEPFRADGGYDVPGVALCAVAR